MGITTITEGAPPWLSALLQWSDGMFPTGGYAHSLGLEEVVRMGWVRDEESLRRFLDEHVTGALAQVDLPLAREAHAAAGHGDWEDLRELDELAASLKLAAEARSASSRMGRRRLAMLNRIAEDEFLRRLEETLGAGGEGGQHAIVWGAACREMPAEAALEAYFYQTAACYCLAAPKLIRVGQEAVQRTLGALLRGSRAAVERAMAIPREEIGWFDPALDLAMMRHEIAEERLFIS